MEFCGSSSRPSQVAKRSSLSGVTSHWMPSLPPSSNGSAARGASTFPFRSHRSSPSSAELRHPEAVTVDQARDPRVLLFVELRLETRKYFFLFHLSVA